MSPCHVAVQWEVLLKADPRTLPLTNAREGFSCLDVTPGFFETLQTTSRPAPGSDVCRLIASEEGKSDSELGRASTRIRVRPPIGARVEILRKLGLNGKATNPNNCYFLRPIA